MSRSALLTILMFCSIVSSGQNISVTFTGTGAVTQIDSVTATNQRTNQRVTLPGNETLVLTVNTGISSVSELTNQGVVFPNPFSGKATFTAVVQKPQTVYLNVRNLVGQVVAQTQVFLQPGENLFDLSLATAGIYMVTLTTEEAKSSYKIICIGANTAGNSIQYLSAGSNNHNTQNNQNSPPGSALKSLISGYTLGYTAGDVILYRCRGGIYSSILTDSPASSKNYTILFAACTDLDGKNYSIVNIDTQTWMAENLAYLPAVSQSSAGSLTDPFYYVYGYEGSAVASAKAAASYSRYGVLYNWPAAMTACPTGWHLPTDDEWRILEIYLGMSEYDANSIGGWRNSGSVGDKLKESGTTHWQSTGATNASGFTALPGGYRYYSGGGGFSFRGLAAWFWTSWKYGSSDAWCRTLEGWRSGVFLYYGSLMHGLSVRCLQNDSNKAKRPTISTNSTTDITQTNATSRGNVTSDGGAAVTSRGVCWNTTGTPTTSDSKTTDGTGPGVFTSSISGLTAGTLYYVRAYATNSVGTAYGFEKPFTTTDGTFTDSRDGHNYQYKTIGTQTWMAENLAYLPSVSPSSEGSETNPFYYVYNYENTNVEGAKTKKNYKTYGSLYNWVAALTACPSCWHLPTDAEWTILTDYLGTSAGGKLREAGTTHWESPNTGATNTSGFTALPGGFRNSYGGFGSLGNSAYFWSSSENGSLAWFRNLGNSGDGVMRSYIYPLGCGFSVRCLQN